MVVAMADLVPLLILQVVAQALALTEVLLLAFLLLAVAVLV